MEQNKCDLSHGEVEIPIIETCSSMQCFEPLKWSCYLFQFTVQSWRHNQEGHQSSRQHSRIHPQQSDFIVGGILLNHAEVKNILLLKSCITELGVSSVPIFHHDILLQSGNTMTCSVWTCHTVQSAPVLRTKRSFLYQIQIPKIPIRSHCQPVLLITLNTSVKLHHTKLSSCCQLLFSHCSFVSVVLCMCMYMYSCFLFGFFPHERFFPPLGFYSPWGFSLVCVGLAQT